MPKLIGSFLKKWLEDLSHATLETISNFSQRASLSQLTEKHRHKLRPTAKATRVTLGLEFAHVSGKIRTLKERQNLGKQTRCADHLRSPLMMGCGFNFTRILVRDGDLFQPFSKPNLDSSVTDPFPFLLSRVFNMIERRIIEANPQIYKKTFHY